MDIQKRIKAFSELGKRLCNTSGTFDELIENAYIKNKWFTESNVRTAINAIANNLTEEKLTNWTSIFNFQFSIFNSKRVGVIMAGNLPLVGFHDFLCVLISGHKFFGKLSSDDSLLLPAIAEILIDIEPEFRDYISFSEGKLEGFDSVIATGSNNTSRYFEYYFGKYPHIIRKNRNSLAVLNGKETKEELEKLCDDIFLYFGLGCRNVSKIFVPENYTFDNLFKAAEKYSNIINHSKYYNNYIYNRSIYIINITTHLDNGFLILKHDTSLSSPVSVLYYEYYSDLNNVIDIINIDRDKIQCIVSNIPELRTLNLPAGRQGSELKSTVSLGQSQYPELWDYADDVDTMGFLAGLG